MYTCSCSDHLSLSTIYAAFAEVILNEPTEAVCKTMCSLAQTLGAPPYKANETEADLVKRYAEHFLIASSKCYVPPWENSLRQAVRIDGVLNYGPLSGAHSRHVLRCYNQFGFDYRNLKASGPSTLRSRPDSLGVEAAFLAYAHSRCAQGSNIHDLVCREYTSAFVRDHLGQWVSDYARLTLAQGCDVYANLISIFAQFVENAIDQGVYAKSNNSVTTNARTKFLRPSTAAVG